MKPMKALEKITDVNCVVDENLGTYW